ncbi:MAG: hypothetical protein VCD00_09280 [Candidatus Hydrogenedentota bacterium]
MSFRVGEPVRWPTPVNFADLVFVPLLIKYPEQKEGVRDSRSVQTVDIFPTIMGVLGAQVDWPQDGQSLLDADNPLRTEVKVFHHSRDEALVYDSETSLRLKGEAHNWVVKIFSLDDPRSKLFFYGDALGVVGQTRRGLRSREVDCAFYDLESSVSRVWGKLDPGEHDATTLQVVVSINDVIAGSGAL